MKKYLSLFLCTVIVLCSFAFPAQAKSVVNLNISSENISHEVSKTLYGVFIEDIYKACDGGLVSNLVYNNSFEYNDTDEINPELNEAYWNFVNINHEISFGDPMNENNPTYETLSISGTGTLTNLGCVENLDYKMWNPNEKLQSKADIGFKKGVRYEFSCYIKNIDFDGTIIVYLDSPSNSDKRVQINISESSADWRKFYADFESSASEDGALTIEFSGNGSLQFDFVQLIPDNSYGYNSHEWQFTTLRADLYEAIEALNPSFIRFPGGCFCEGDSLENLFNWKDTVGPLERRVQTYNICRNNSAGDYYINTNSMGYGEYFNLCSDLGAEPVPFLNVGIACQEQNDFDINLDARNKISMTDDEFVQYLIDFRHYDPDDKQGIKERTTSVNSLAYQSEEDWNNYLDSIALNPGTAEWNNYVQDVLDFIEFANGDTTTTYWGALRAAYGHFEPYNLKYLGLGNENWGEIYWRNFDALYKAVKEEYPDITIITSSGSTIDGYDFDYAWENANSKYIDCYVDEHYYTASGYMYEINDRFDSYDRNGAKIFVGEYAATSNSVGTLQVKSTWEALEEAAYMTGFERNGDIVAMTAYAPALAKINSQNRAVNEICFDSQDVVLTPSYYTQMLYSNNIGTRYVDASFSDDISVNELAQSVTVDEDNQVIYVKLVNSSGKKQKVNLNLSGFENINYASNQSIASDFKSACNELNKPVYVSPIDIVLNINEDTITVEAEKYSVNVIRIAYGDNAGDNLYHLPDVPMAHFYLPVAIKIAIPCAAGAVVLAVILTTVVVKTVKKHKKNKGEQ